MSAGTGPANAGTHIFLSYAAEDRELAHRLADALAAHGHSVWWDRLIAGGALWGHAIDRALADAWAVIVLWSPASVRSDFVRAEARRAADRGVLVPARVAACEPPMPFGEYQTVDLAKWSADASPEAPAPLLDALQFVRTSQGVEHPKPRPEPGAGTPWLLTYVTELFQLGTGPKAFLLARWTGAQRVARASRFYVTTAALKLLIGLPLVLKLGGAVSWEIFGALVYGPLRMLALGGVVHLAFRAVGGTGAPASTLVAFAYLHSLQMLLFECTQGIAVGVLRLVAPELAGPIFAGVIAGQPQETMMAAVQEQGFGRSLTFLMLAWWPLVVVPFAGWGAFRVGHQVSRLRSAAAALLALVFGLVAYVASVLLSYLNGGPG
jgi:hypothetical protein